MQHPAASAGAIFQVAIYILKERIRLAKKHLQDPLNSVTQACYMAGFQNLNYFIRAFKNQVGLTPKAYQLQNTGIS
ncbi:hypothetical protein GCM10027443_14600 [Pontibacter brevis]